MLNVQKTTAVQKSYTGETGCGLVELLIDPNGRDKKYPTFKHAVKKNHKPPSTDEFRVIDRRYNNNTYKKKNCRIFVDKGTYSKPEIHEKSVPLKFFN